MATRANPASPSERTTLSECIDRLASDGAARRPLSTYRVQFHKGFTFNDARAIVPYLHSLGITHLYGSPILKARPGSVHGYDINDHNQLNPEVGTEDDFRALVAELKSRNMSFFLDVVPNHMGVGYGTNPWWHDVLENGRASAYADYFDIDWQPVKTELRDKVLIPILGDPYGEVLERGELKLAYVEERFIVWYYERQLPIDPQTWPLIFEPFGDLRALPQEIALPEDDRTDFEAILWDLRALAPNRETDPALVAKRRKELPELRARFSALYARSACVKTLVDHGITVLNGNPADSASFDPLHRLLEAQAFRVAFWRVSVHEINYRRFFDINDLVGLRMENPKVFAETHRLIRRMLADGSIEGIRLDHPDGLYNPLQYFTRLQTLFAAARCFGAEPASQTAENGIELEVMEAFGARDWSQSSPPLYVLVEKILEHGEHLPVDWPVDGTVGYEFAVLVNGLFIDSRNERALSNAYRRFTGVTDSVPDMVYKAKKIIMRTALASEVTVLSHMLEEVAALDRRARDYTRATLTDAIREVVACFPVYRTYVDERGNVSEGDSGYIMTAIRRAKRRNPGTNALIFDFLQKILLLEGSGDSTSEAHRKRLHFVLKFQQLTGPVMAKGLEDTVFYRYNRLVSVNEVGGSPDQFGVSVSEFHAGNLERLRDWPHSMLSTSTHDTKRSEDVRARIDVLSEMPKQWPAATIRWRRINATKKTTLSDGRVVPDANEEYLLYQTMIGAWPLERDLGGERDEFIRRIQQYMNKAIHEAKVNLSWVNDDPDYVAALEKFISAILTPGRAARPNRFLVDLDRFLPAVQIAGAINSVAQALLKLTAPGLPDIYNGCELFDFSLVDPDNRRPVDYEARRRYLDELSNRENGDLAAHCDELVRDFQDSRVKLWTVQRALNTRCAKPELFTRGSYVPLEARGEASEHVVAFARQAEGATAITVVPRLSYTLVRGEARPPLGRVWGNTEIELPGTREMRNVFTGERFGGRVLCRELLGHFPVALLITD